MLRIVLSQSLASSVTRSRRTQRDSAERARHLGSWQVVAAPAEPIPLPAASVDAVLCSVDDLSAVLDEVLRVLRPGGAARVLRACRGQRRAAR
ncbi:methyltransferase domain-containing protein [Kribbella alba]|uniref:methyltransferase domain-containing protein n=1 Tax=Kribbella alba TaxID=190197 RepID=UPI003CD0B961